jgi:RNase adapter protein RapZ
VRSFVLGQPAAMELLDRLESMLRWVAPRQQRNRMTVGIGCTGGRHRSVVMAAELARRLTDLQGFEVQFEARDLIG